VLQAATGSGKTEAVLAPCLERLIQGGRQGAVIYVVPTRALAGDLVRRIEGSVRGRLGLQMAVRTADTKRRGGGRPDLLLTTPESLDVALGSANAELRGFLARAQTVILDEAHAYAGRPRGAQLRFLLERLTRRAGPLQRIALSATLADPEAIIACLDLTPGAAQLVIPGGPELRPGLVQIDGEAELLAFTGDLRERGSRKLLVFADSRRRCEALFSQLNARGRFRGRCELHYSNLSSRERGQVEARFRERSESLCVATSTLELGIDIGDVDAVLLYGPPATASAFLQRIGRAGRRIGVSTVWGLCYGEGAGQQLLRFVGLLRLAREGGGERPWPRGFPSVLAQQVLSCLYEQRALTPESLEELFPEQRAVLDRLLPVMVSGGWLRLGRRGLLEGGWRYYQAKVELRIWGNFPREEPPFALEVEQEVVAELPAQVVKQLEVGDRVQLAARRLRILSIEPGQRRRVEAAPTDEPPTAEPAWVGLSAPVSLEAARSVREVLDGEDLPEGLHARTRRLLERERARPVARLESGLELYRTPTGGWRYRTLLGTFGNLLLRAAIRERLPKEIDVWSDALGVECGARVDFQALALPIGRERFADWTRRHLRLLRAAVPLGAYSAALPPELLVEELAAHLYDPRLDEAFQRLLSASSRVVGGDPAALEIPVDLAPARAARARFPAGGEPPLAAARRGLPPLSPPPEGPPRPLSATRFASWIRLAQCPRYLGWSARSETLSRAANLERAARGQAHEARVLDALERRYGLERVAARDPGGALRPLAERRRETIERLAAAAAALRGGPEATRYLAQPVLTRDDLLPGVGAVGIPDLLEVSWRRGQLVIAPGDIKSSAAARYDQKAQVAFYGLLLEGALPEGAALADEGFLILWPLPGGPPRVDLPLAPWLELAPDTLALLQALLATSPESLDWRLGPVCAACPFVGRCLPEALSRDEVQLLPGLRRGELEALHRLGIHRLEGVAAQTERELSHLVGGARALLEHRIEEAGALSRVPEGALEHAVGVAVEVDSVTGLPAALALLDLEDQGGAPERWEGAELAAIWGRFMEALERRAPGRWLLHYGGRSLRLLDALGEHYTPERWRAVSRAPDTGARQVCDLRLLLLESLHLPTPGAASLYAVGRALGLSPTLAEPPTLLHPEAELPDRLDDQLAVMAAAARAVGPSLRSVAEGITGPTPEGGPDLQALLRFLERERRLRREGIQALQALPLAERVARFGALGPLLAAGASLDEEGRPVHRLTVEGAIGATRLREGDFLRLAPLGSADLQAGLPVILSALDRRGGELGVRCRGRRRPAEGRRYSLEADLDDFGHPRLVEVSEAVLSRAAHPLYRMLIAPSATLPGREEDWGRRWLAGPGAAAGLEARQEEALLLAFQREVAVIEGPPGTGKTRLLGWILAALLLRAAEVGRPLRIAVTALTHQAIDEALRKLVGLARRLEGFPARVMKLGRQAGDAPEPGLSVEALERAETILASPRVVVGATGQGLRRLLGRESQTFDWIVCDEASQLLLPQVWLALAHGAGRALFLGDSRQLPPVVRGRDYEVGRTLDPSRSVLEHLRAVQPVVRLDRSYRLNDGLCAFPSRTWYEGSLTSAPAVAAARLAPSGGSDLLDRILAPEPPAALLLLDHRGRRERCPEEAEVLAALAERLLVDRGLPPERLAIISPHRAQNSLITEALAARVPGELPVIDTVERLQGAERDVVLFGLVASEPDRVESDFLTDPRRFNVAITRARLKLVVVASRAFFSGIPRGEEALLARRHLLAFKRFCAERGGLFLGE